MNVGVLGPVHAVVGVAVLVVILLHECQYPLLAVRYAKNLKQGLAARLANQSYDTIIDLTSF